MNKREFSLDKDVAERESPLYGIVPPKTIDTHCTLSISNTTQ